MSIEPIPADVAAYIDEHSQQLPPMTSVLRSFMATRTETVRVKHLDAPDELMERNVEPGPVEIHMIDGSKIGGKIVGTPGLTVEIDSGTEGVWTVDVAAISVVRRLPR